MAHCILQPLFQMFGPQFLTLSFFVFWSLYFVYCALKKQVFYQYKGCLKWWDCACFPPQLHVWVKEKFQEYCSCQGIYNDLQKSILFLLTQRTIFCVCLCTISSMFEFEDIFLKFPIWKSDWMNWHLFQMHWLRQALLPFNKV